MAGPLATRKGTLTADPPGTTGDDIIPLRAGEHTVVRGAGDHLIRVRAAGPSLIDGQGGNDRIVLIAADAGCTLRGGSGDDVLRLRGGAVIVDAQGTNRLRIEGAATVAEMMQAAEAACSRAGTGLPEGLVPFTALGQPVALEVTDAGFYGRVLRTADNELIVAFEGTDIREISARTDFVPAQIMADAKIDLGMVPPAFAIAAAAVETLTGGFA